MCAAVALSRSFHPEPITDVKDVFTEENKDSLNKYMFFIGDWGVQLAKTGGQDNSGTSGSVVPTRHPSFVAKSFNLKHAGQAQREAEILCYLSRENIPYTPRLYGVSTHNTLRRGPILILNNAGKDLQNSLDELRLGDIAKITKQTLKCLKYLASKGITHGDLKLENICYLRAKRVITLIDWEGATLPNNLPGMTRFTNCYLPPEACLELAYANDVERTKKDVWALGAITFNLLASFPFVGYEEKTNANILQTIEQRLFPIPHEMIEASPKWDDIFFREESGRYSFRVLSPHQYAPVGDALAEGKPLDPSDEDKYHKIGALALDLLKINPEERPFAEEALMKHFPPPISAVAVVVAGSEPLSLKKGE